MSADALKNMMKGNLLVYLVGQLGVGGYERQLYYLLRAMDRERYRPIVAVWNFKEDDRYVRPIQELGVPVVALPEAAGPAAKLRAFSRLVEDLKPEVVHSHSFYTNFAVYWGTRSSRAIAVGSLHSDFKLDKKAAGLWRGLLCARWPRFQISNNCIAAEAARGFFSPSRLSVVRNGIDLERFASSPLRTNGRAHILGVGSLLPVKRWDRLIAAAAELKDRGHRFALQIAGDGPLRSELNRQIIEMGLSGDVDLLGDVEDVSSLLSGSTFLAHTSDTEGCPNSVMEAMACGRAVVATDVGDIPRLVEDGRTGYVVRRGDGQTLVKRLAELVDDNDACARMGEMARAKAEREFSLERLVSQTLSAYREAGWHIA